MQLTDYQTFNTLVTIATFLFTHAGLRKDNQPTDFLFSWLNWTSASEGTNRTSKVIINLVLHGVFVLFFTELLAPATLSDSNQPFAAIAPVKIMFFAIAVTVAIYKAEDLRKI